MLNDALGLESRTMYSADHFCLSLIDAFNLSLLLILVSSPPLDKASPVRPSDKKASAKTGGPESQTYEFLRIQVIPVLSLQLNLALKHFLNHN